MGNTVLVLGGAGFIGSNICKRFLTSNYKVTVIDGLLDKTGGSKKNLQSVIPQIEFINRKIEDVSNLNRLVNANDIIIDCMAWTRHLLGIKNPFYDLSLNVQSHLVLIQILKDYPNKNVIYLGSRGQYGNPNIEQISEQYTMIPEDVQGIHKLTAEHHYRVYSKLFKFNVISLRFGNCFGPNQPYQGEDIGLVGGLIRDLLEKKKVVVFGKKRKRSLVYVNDLCEVVFRLAQKGSIGFVAYNFNGQEVYIEYLVKILIDIIGYGTYKIKALPRELKDIDIGSAILSNIRLNNLIGEIPETNLETSFAQTINYFEKFYGKSI